MPTPPTTYVAVNLDAVRNNVRQVLARVAEGSRLCAVVKANAYGHGAGPVALACVEAGAAWVAVSTVEEGVAVREAGCTAPVLVFMPPLATEMEAAVEHDLTVTFTRTAQVMEMRREGERQGKAGSGHVYEDLGLGRLGPSENIMDIIAAADPWSEVHVKGVYTHFGPPRSGVDLDSFEWVTAGATLRVYASMLHDAMRQFTDRRMLLHVAASAMLLEDPMSHFDMVRVGTLLYGQYPEHVPAGKRDLDLLDTFELRSHIVEVHEVRKGARIGYGGEFVCARPTRVATVPVGFAHGLGTVPESVSGRPRSFLKALLRARDSRRGRAGSLPSARLDAGRAPLIGRISMDQCALDVTDLPDVDRGTEVVLPVRRLAVPASIPRVYLP